MRNKMNKVADEILAQGMGYEMAISAASKINEALREIVHDKEVYCDHCGGHIGSAVAEGTGDIALY